VEDGARFLARGIADVKDEQVVQQVEGAKAEAYTRRALVVGQAAPMLNGIVQLVDRATLAPAKGVANSSPTGRRQSTGTFSRLASDVSRGVEANGFLWRVSEILETADFEV